MLQTNTTGTAILSGQTPKACPPIQILPAPVPFLAPTAEGKFHHVKIQPKLTQQHQPGTESKQEL